MNETFSIDYSAKLPEIIQFTKEGKPETIEITVVAVQEAILPEINEEFIKKTFGTEEVKNESDVREKVKEIIVENKKESGLTNAIDAYLGKIKDSFDVQIPNTLINHEVDHRVKKLIEQFGGEENFKRYIQQRGEEEVQKLTESITAAANQSLERYFIFKKVIEVNELDVDWEKALDAETKLYDKLAK
jgi:trigger factor